MYEPWKYRCLYCKEVVDEDEVNEHLLEHSTDMMERIE
jgi:hypothetical protein